MFYRILVNGVLFFSILFLPWWFTFFLACGVLLTTESFYEIFALSLFADALYGTNIVLFYHLSFLFSATALILFLIFRYAQREMRLK